MRDYNEKSISRRTLYLLTLVISLLIVVIPSAFAQTPEITNGLVYLTSTQNLDGSWDSDTTDVLPATVAAIEAMQILGETSSQNYADAILWLQSQTLDTTDYLSERIHALSDAGTDLDVVISYFDGIYTGAWGGYESFDSNNLDTVIALQALSKINYSDLDTISSALFYLIYNQNTDGGWGFKSDQKSSTYYTMERFFYNFIWIFV